MPCDDCSRTEKCPPCPHEEGVTCAVLHQDTQGNTIPCPDRKPQGSEVSSSPDPLSTPCACGHALNWHIAGSKMRNCTVTICRCERFQPEPKPCTCGPDEVCGDLCEPPLTPEEEEEAACPHESWEVSSQWRDEESGKWMKSRRCADCREELTIVRDDEAHEFGGPTEPPPPQPERRPPYAVAYSVQGHLYEVALPGDATVKAVDGALVIQHHLGPVAGIVQVLPVINKENSDV